MDPRLMRDLGGGFILRRSSVEDTERLVAFHGDLHRDPGAEEPEKYVAAWTHDLMKGDHPTFDPADFTIVEDVRTGAIISSLCLISQIWSYGGVRFGVGRPELVATHPDYRRRGLIRAQFEVIHGWSAERGEQMQAITGIPWYYRQFGYEMGLTLGGGRACYKPQIPSLKDGAAEPYHVRPAAETDLPFIAQAYDYGIRRYPVACAWDEALWRYELLGKSENNVNRQALSLIETPQGEPVGFLAHSARLWQGRVGITGYELKPGVSWLAVTPSVMRYLWGLGERWATPYLDKEMEGLNFWLGVEHPAFQAMHKRLPHTIKPYAWYVRVPDLPAFLRHVAVVLEQRLAASPLVGHSGELKISFYRDGLRLAFEEGQLTCVEPWQPTREEGRDAVFPDLTFLQLLFGYRSLDELEYAFADCGTSGDEGRALLAALFPKCPSDIWPVS